MDGNEKPQSRDHFNNTEIQKSSWLKMNLPRSAVCFLFIMLSFLLQRERQREMDVEKTPFRRCMQPGTSYVKTPTAATGGDWHAMFDLDANLMRIAPVSAFRYAPLHEQFVELEEI